MLKKILKSSICILLTLVLIINNDILTPSKAHAQENKVTNTSIKNNSVDSNTKDHELQETKNTETISLNGFTYNIKSNCIDIGTAYTSNCSDVKFKWLSYNLDTKTWYTISDWYSGNWTTWKPTVGNYWVVVQAKTPNGTTAQNVLCFNVNKDYNNKLELKGICYIVRNNQIDVGVDYYACDSFVEFQWKSYNLDTKQWNTITEWNKGNWASWKPEKGKYWLTVLARLKDGTTKDYTICFNVDKDYTNKLELKGICYTVRNNQIDVGVDYYACDSSVEFQWKSYNLDTKQWNTITEWNKGNWASWKPEKGKYWLTVLARLKDGTTKDYTICFNVDKDYMLSIASITHKEHSNRIELNVQCNGSSRPFVYKWSSYNEDSAEWTVLKDWSDKSEATWNPTIGNYKIKVQVADRDGVNKTETIDYNVTKDYSIPQPKITEIYVGQDYEYTTINKAIDHAIKRGVSKEKPFKIIVDEGIYLEQIVYSDIHGLMIEGRGASKTIVEYRGPYPDCVFHISGDIIVSNLTIRNTNNQAYAVHIDAGGTGIKGKICFSNCVISGGACAIGYGSNVDTELCLIDCVLSGNSDIIYAHNSAYSTTGQKLVIESCTFVHTKEKHILKIDDASYSYFKTNSPMVVIAINNSFDGILPGQIAFRKDTFSGETLNYIPNSDTSILLSPNNGNNKNINGLERQ